MRLVALAAATAGLALATPARADAIDGHWCTEGGLRLASRR